MINSYAQNTLAKFYKHAKFKTMKYLPGKRCVHIFKIALIKTFRSTQSKHTNIAKGIKYRKQTQGKTHKEQTKQTK